MSQCLRCGRILKEAGFQKWRWTGFNFGLDLILITDTKTLSVKRHHRTDHERLLSLQTKRNFLIRVTVSSLNDQRQIKHLQTSGIKSLSMDKNEEIPLIVMDNKFEYPLLISVNLLVTSISGTLLNKSPMVSNNNDVPISNIDSSKTNLDTSSSSASTADNNSNGTSSSSSSSNFSTTTSST